MSIQKRRNAWCVRWREGGSEHSRSFLRKGDAVAFEADVKRRLQIGRALADQTPAAFMPSVAQTPIDERAVARAMQARPRPKRSLSDRTPLVRAGMTYAIASDPYDGWTKLGRCDNNPVARLADLQCGNPRPLVIRAVWPVDAEDFLHHVYDEFRGQGEWFALPKGMWLTMQDVAGEDEPYHALVLDWPVEYIRMVAGARARGPEGYAARFRDVG